MDEPFAHLPFSQAAEQWLKSRRPFLRGENTYRRYGFYMRPLVAFFSVELAAITAEDIRAYQRTRLASVRATTINHECSLLHQILHRAGCWRRIADDYQPLPVPKTESGRALSEEEYARLFRAAATNPNWEAAYLFAVISINTTAGPKEAATLRLKDVDLEQELIFVHEGGAKNEYRIRHIPLNQEALRAARKAVERAKALGAAEPEHYLFPFRIKKGKYDPTRRQVTFKTAWRELCAVAEVKNFHPYCCRHHAITALLENPDVSEQTAEALAGHISARMKRRYAHIRMEYKRAAVEALQKRREGAQQQMSVEDVASQMGISSEVLLRALLTAMAKGNAPKKRPDRAQLQLAEVSHA